MCMHRIVINLTATNKSYTDQGLSFSEPKSGVFQQSRPCKINVMICLENAITKNGSGGASGGGECSVKR